MVEKKITKIQWTRKAQKRLKDIKTYYKENASESVADHIVSNIVVSVSKLYLYPDIGQVELNLEDLPAIYRYLLEGHYKIIYKHKGATIYIMTVFDCRQDLSKLLEDITSQK